MGKRKRKILTGIGLFLLLIGGFGLYFKYYWIDEELPKIINEKNKSPYFITYKNLDVSLLTATIKASDIVLVPKAALKDSIHKHGIYATVESVQVNRFSIWSLFAGNRLKASSIELRKPKITIYKKSDSKPDYSRSVSSSVAAPFEKVVSVKEIRLRHADVAILYPKTEKPMLRATNVSADVSGIAITDEILKRKIPFAFGKYSFSCDSIYYKPNIYYHLKTGKIESANDRLELHRLEYLSDMNRRDFVKSVPTERDMYNIKAEKLSLEGLDWGFREDDKLFVHSKTLRLDRVNANIYRDKRKTDDKRKKKLYNALLRELNFDLKIDTLTVRNSRLEYEEQVNDVAPGTLRWNPFNLTALNVWSAFGRTKMPDVQILIDAKFMDVSPLKADWRLNVLDKSDGFRIKGSIKSFPVERIAEFSKPYMNFTGKGILDEVYFDFKGNDDGSKGTFGINYDDLKFTVYKKKDRKKKNKFLSSVANLFVKNDTKEKVKRTEIEVEREKDKSFYNMFWKSIADGLVKILI